MHLNLCLKNPAEVVVLRDGGRKNGCRRAEFDIIYRRNEKFKG
jgi:hypothetical protein